MKIPFGYRHVVFFDMCQLRWLRGLIMEEQAKTFPYRCYMEWEDHIHQDITLDDRGSFKGARVQDDAGKEFVDEKQHTILDVGIHCVRYEPWMSNVAPYAWRQKTSAEIFAQYQDKSWKKS